MTLVFKEAERLPRQTNLRQKQAVIQFLFNCIPNRKSANLFRNIIVVPAGKPPSREAVVEWFRNQEVKRGVGLDENNKPVDWFHGKL